MLNLFYKFGKTKLPFKAPDRWSDVSFKTYIEFNKLIESDYKTEELYSLFTGLDAEYWKKPHNPKLFINLDGQLAFLSEQPLTEVPTHLERKGKYYKIEKNFLNLSLGKYRDIIEVVSSLSAEDDKQSSQLSLFPKMIAVLACKGYDTEEELEEIAKDIEKLPCDLVYSLGCFFLKKLTVLKNGTSEKLSILERIKRIYKLVMTKLVAIMVIFIVYILSPKEILRGMKRFCQKAWVLFTGGNNYKVVSINPTNYTVI